MDHDIIATHEHAAAAAAYCKGDGARCGQPWNVAAQLSSNPNCNSIECKTETAGKLDGDEHVNDMRERERDWDNPRVPYLSDKLV